MTHHQVLIGALAILAGLGPRNKGNPTAGQDASHYYVILSSDTTAGEARDKAAAAGAWVLPTNLYSNLTPNLFAVVRGPFSSADAQTVLGFLRGAHPDAYVRNAGAWPGMDVEVGGTRGALVAVLLGQADLARVEHQGGSNGCEPQERYIEVAVRDRTADSEGYVVIERSGEVRPVGRCELQSYEEYLSMLDVDDPYSVSRALESFKWHFSPTGFLAHNDSAIVAFRALYDNARRRYSRLIPDGTPEMLRRVRTAGAATTDSLAAEIWTTLTTNGFKVVRRPIGDRIEEDPEFLAPVFRNHASASMREFLFLRRTELEQVGAMWSLSSEYQRALVTWEAFIAANPNFVWRGEAAQFYIGRLKHMFVPRYRGPPLFDWRDGRSLLRETYERFVQEHGDSETGRLIAAYLELLRSVDYKCMPQVEEFLLGINLADLNFGSRPLHPPESRAARLFPGESIGMCDSYADVVARPAPPPMTELESVTTEQRRILVGDRQQHLGELTASDQLFRDSVYLQGWEIAGRRDVEVNIAATSAEFDVAFMVIGPGLDEALVGEELSCGARLYSIRFPQDASYKVIVTSRAPRQTGGFLLRARAAPGNIGCPRQPSAPESPSPVGPIRPGRGRVGVPLAELPMDDRRLAIGQSASGELTTRDQRRIEGRGGSYVQAWGIEGRRGASVTIDLIREDRDYDPLLTVLGPGIDPPLTDFHSGGACNARLTVRFPQDGLYRIIVGSTGPMPIGSFTLRVTALPGPLAPGVC